MDEIKVSLIASSVRPQFYQTFLETLIGTSVKCEVIFVGNARINSVIEAIKFANRDKEMVDFNYVSTENIKPAQCYEIARRKARGETVIWTADDCEHTPDIVGKAYNYWKEQNNDKWILSIQTIENKQICNMLDHSFFGWNRNSPLMAPLGLMSRAYLEKLGGFDRRYICGQYENDVVMRVIADGGDVKVFGDKDNCIIIDHYRKHGILRPFAKGYNHDRQILEGSWVKDGKVSLKINDKFEPYADEGILEKSQSFNLESQWV